MFLAVSKTNFNADKARDFLKESDNLVASLCENSKKLNESAQYEKVRESLKVICGKTFNGLPVVVHLFGSRIIGIATDASDLDMFVDIGGRFHSNYNVSKSMDTRFNKLAAAVHLSDDWQVNNRYLKTAVPVIKSIYRPTHLDCDIIMTNGLSTCHSKLLAHWFVLQPEAVSLFHFIKQWLKIQGFYHFQGYTMTLLMVFYLQTFNFLPSVEAVQCGVPKEIIATWEVQFNTNHGLSDHQTPKMQSYKNYIRGFFKFYSDFDYSSQVMSTFKGCAIDADQYRLLYPKFLFKGIFIVGPFNKGKNSGVVDNDHKVQFIKLCKESTSFLNNVEQR